MANEGIEEINKLSEYKLEIRFRVYDNIMRDTKTFIPKEKSIINYDVFSLSLEFKGATLSNDAKPNDPFLKTNRPSET